MITKRVVVYIGVASIGFVFVFCLSILANTFVTAFIRGIGAFFVFLLVGILLNKALSFALKPSPDSLNSESHEDITDNNPLQKEGKKDSVVDEEFITSTSAYISELLKDKD